jgi:argininosuccinate synthase
LKKLIHEGHEVVAMTADLGESDALAGAAAQAALEAARVKAIALGAYDAVVIDARERFVDDYAFPALRANALYQDAYPLSAALSRPLIAELLVETAQPSSRMDAPAKATIKCASSSPCVRSIPL